MLNYGLEGAATMQLPVAEQIARDVGPGAAVVVIDCAGDMTAAQVASNTAPLVEFLRQSKAFAKVPIVLVEAPPQSSQWLLRNSTEALNAALRAQFDALLTKHPVCVSRHTSRLHLSPGRASSRTSDVRTLAGLGVSVALRGGVEAVPLDG